MQAALQMLLGLGKASPITSPRTRQNGVVQVCRRLLEAEQLGRPRLRTLVVHRNVLRQILQIMLLAAALPAFWLVGPVILAFFSKLQAAEGRQANR